MISIRKSHERGHAHYGWLDTRYSFSFADYYDPRHMGVSRLRVLNDDRVAPGAGFPAHGHRDMEIVTYVLDGALAHRDSMGNGSLIKAGDVQRMSAGTGVTHSEYNASREAPLHLLQIWITPSKRGMAPSYEQVHVPSAEKRGGLRLVAAPDGGAGALTVHQDIRLYAALLDGEACARHVLAAGRTAYVHVARGAVAVNGAPLDAGDGATVRDEATVRLDRGRDAEVLLFDLP